jgi:rhodanese-related sulfurtransferase
MFLPPISAQELKHRLANKEILTILDIRTQYEFDDFNMGGIHIPANDLLLKNTLPLQPFKDTELIIVCGTGLQSAVIVRILSKKGFLQVRNLEGGIEAFLGI